MTTNTLSTSKPCSSDASAGVKPLCLDIAYTPDSDDVFNFYAWEHDKIGLSHANTLATFHRNHIIALNHAAEQGTYDVVGVSSVAYPRLADRYAVLATGNSVGRGYGPVLVSKHYDDVNQLRGKRVGVAGIPTTGGCLAMMYCPGAEYIEMQFDLIADAVVRGELDAGVMIHEELLFYPDKGLHRVRDLGVAWCDDTGLPLPVGLNLVRRSLGQELMHDIQHTCRRSMAWARENFDEAFAFASGFGRGCAQDHVAMFSNADTECLPADVRKAMGLMFKRIAELGLGPAIGEAEIIDA